MPFVRSVARHAFSAWFWAAFVGNTAVRVGLGHVLTPFIGSRRAFARSVWNWGRTNMRWGLHVCEVEPHPEIPAPSILFSNHQHFFDITLIASIVPPPLYFVARLEVDRVPLIGSVLRNGGHVFVARGAGSANEDALGDAVARLEEGGRVLFFGEGTRSKTDEILRLRSGALRLAARTGAPLVPLVIAGTRRTFPSGLWPIVPARMAAAFLPPRMVDAAEAKSAAYREALRAEMGAALARLTPRTRSRW